MRRARTGPFMVLMQRISSFGRCDTRLAPLGMMLTSQQLNESQPAKSLADRLHARMASKEGKLANIATELDIMKELSEVFREQPSKKDLHIIVKWLTGGFSAMAPGMCYCIV